MIKFIIFLIIGAAIFFLISGILLPFNEKEIKNNINNPNEYLESYINETNITQEENDDVIKALLYIRGYSGI